MEVKTRVPTKLRRPRHATVVAYLALFVALGGGALAATHLGKNTVGTKQLKKSSVTGVKVKDGSLTGRDIDAATLGQVPSAKTAASSATATSAGNAGTVGGLPSSAFAPSGDFLFGAADTDAATPQVILTDPGFFQITTVASAGTTFKLLVVNLASDEVDVSESSTATVVGIAKGSKAQFGPPVRAALFLIYDTGRPQTAASVQCGLDVEPDRLACFATLSPA